LCADLREYHVCLSACLKADVVFHLADVVAGIDFVFANEGAVFRSNILINSNVFRAAQETSVKRLIYVGAACSYPKELQAVPGGPPLVEEQAYPASPESAYGWSKLIGEYEAELLMKNTDVQVAILRLHNVYGPRAEFSIQRSQVVPSLIRKAIRFPKEDFVVWGTGRQTRSFIYINDVIEALLRASVKGLNSGPIQIGTSEQVAIREVAETIVRISGKRIPIMFDPKKPEGDGGRSANCDKAKRILGWQAFTPMDVGLELTYQWIQNAIEVRAKAGV
jgi:nucleoside-diphosphate-sugar epimerase